MNSTPAPAHQLLPPLVLACLLATWLVWGSTYLAIKFALSSLPPFFQMGTRFLFAGVLLMTWMRLRGRPWPDPIEWRNAALVGGLMLGGGVAGAAYAEQSVASGLVVAFIAVCPLLITTLNCLWGVRPSPLETAGILTGLVGVMILTGGAGFRGSPAGLVAMLVACTAWSLGSVLSQRATPLAPGAMGYASEMVCGGVLLLAVSAFTGETPRWPPEAVAVAAWCYLVVAGSLIGFSAYMYLLGHASAAIASSYTFVNPVIALLLGVTLADEVVSDREWAATGVVLVGVVLMLAGARRGTRGED
ncbi:MAG: drug/metabolite exporter YedA [Gammaproteobacteria bacterium]